MTTAASTTTSIQSTEKPVEVGLEEWTDNLRATHIARADMNRLIMDYLVTEGFKEAAEKFQIESGLKAGVDLDTLDNRIQIREAMQAGHVQDAIALVNRLHPELLDNDRYLYFHLQQQHLIELIRERRLEDALEFAQEQLAERGEENVDVLQELERTMALLAFTEPEKSPFGELLHPSQRQKVASELNAAILEQENQKSAPKLANLLKLLLWTQQELDSKKIKYPQMVDLAKGEIQDK